MAPVSLPWHDALLPQLPPVTHTRWVEAVVACNVTDGRGAPKVAGGADDGESVAVEKVLIGNGDVTGVSFPEMRRSV